MSRLERFFWITLAIVGMAVGFWTVMLPEDEGRRLWNDHDPVWCSVVGSAIIVVCLVSMFRQVNSQR